MITIKLEVVNNKPFYVIDGEACPVEQLDIEVAQRLIERGGIIYFVYDFNKQQYKTLIECLKDEISLEYCYYGIFRLANDFLLKWTSTPALGLDAAYRVAQTKLVTHIYPFLNQ